MWTKSWLEKGARVSAWGTGLGTGWEAELEGEWGRERDTGVGRGDGNRGPDSCHVPHAVA